MENSRDSKLNIAVIGLGFGAEFPSLYAHHSNVGHVVLCDNNSERLNTIGDKYGFDDRRTDFNAIISDRSIDAVHVITGFPLHADQTVAVLESGKHCACTVPMAMNIKDLQRIVSAVRRSKKNYMMMETAVYDRTFLHVKDMVESGKMGRIQLLRGAHYQDMENWPSYWAGLPPMWYATHAIAPLLALAKTRASKVHCFGSGSMRKELHAQYKNPYPIETAIFQLEGIPIAAEVTRALYHSARAYTESFNVYGEDICFEWQQFWCDDPVLFHLSPLGAKNGPRVTTEKRIKVADRADLLPEPLRRFTTRGVYDASNSHRSFLHGGGHGGSHPHMVHEFVSSIVENRKAWVNEVTAANWTAAGICAHESAMQGGKCVEVPSFDDA
jgi:predicted dehydrogenase